MLDNKTHHYLYSKISVETKYLKVCSSKSIPDPESFFASFEAYQSKDGGGAPGLKVFKVPIPSNNGQKKEGSVWIAKMGFYEEGLNDLSLAQDASINPCSLALRTYNYIPIMEKIASDCYELLSQNNYIVPRTKLAKMPIENAYTSNSTAVNRIIIRINQDRVDNPITELVYFMSKEVSNYNTFENTEVVDPENNKNISIQRYIVKFKRPPETIIHEEHGEIPLIGLMEVLAIARIINDIDVLGSMLSNIGYVLEKLPGKGIVAKIVKIDPGYGFNKHNCSYYLNTLEYIEKVLKPRLNDSKDLDLATINSKYLADHIKTNVTAKKYKDNYILDDLRDIQFRTQNYGVIQWQCLTQTQKTQFLSALHYGLAKLDDQVVDFLIYRNGAFDALEQPYGAKSQFAQRRISFLQKQVRELKIIYGIKDTFYYPAAPANPQVPLSKRVIINVGPKVASEILQETLTQWVSGYTYFEKFTLSTETIEQRIRAKEKILACSKLQCDELDLSNLNFGVLHEGIFCHLPHLRSLKLDNTDLTYLPNDIFSLNKLSSINLSNTPISDFDYLYKQVKNKDIDLELNENDKLKYINVMLEDWVHKVSWFNKEYTARNVAKAKILDCINENSSLLDLRDMGLSSLPVNLLLNYTNISKIIYEGNEVYDLVNFNKLFCSINLMCSAQQINKFIELSLEAWEQSLKKSSEKHNITEAKKRILKCIKNQEKLLDLSNLNLTSLPESILKFLYYIHKLNLNSNQLKSLPNGICHMTDLLKLNVANNQIKTLPEDIGNLRHLVSLDLNGNQLTRLPSSVIRLKNLKSISLRLNKIVNFPTSLLEVTTLKTIDLSFNYLKTLPDSINNLHNLKELYLNHNRLTTITEPLGALTQLRILDISKNAIEKLPDEICNLNNLRKLVATENKIQELPLEIGKLANLIELSIDISPEKSLPESFRQLPENIIYQVGQKYLISRLQNWVEGYNGSDLVKAMRVAISQNLINVFTRRDDGLNLVAVAELINLPSSILVFFQFLSTITLSYTNLQSLPNEITKLKDLRQLIIVNTELASLPAAIANLTELEILNLTGNKLVALPDQISGLTKLKELYLAGNFIKTMPLTMNKLVNLTKLEIDYMLLMRLPPNFSWPSNLERLSIKVKQETHTRQVTQETLNTIVTTKLIQVWGDTPLPQFVYVNNQLVNPIT